MQRRTIVILRDEMPGAAPPGMIIKPQRHRIVGPDLQQKLTQPKLSCRRVFSLGQCNGTKPTPPRFG